MSGARLRLLRLPADTETPVSAFLKLAEPGRGDFLLESVEGGATRGRWSMIGLDPDLLFEARGRQARVNRTWRTNRAAFEAAGEDPLAVLRGLAAGVRMDLPAGLPAATPFLAGYLGYETAALVERIPVAAADPLGLPDLLFARPGVVLVFDRLRDELSLMAPVWPGERARDADARLEAVAARLAGPLPPEPRLAAAPEAAGLGPTLAPERYAAMVDRAKDHIAAGDIFQVVLAQRFTLAFPLPPFALYRALRRLNPSPYLYFLDLPGFAVVGSSPEILVRARDGQVTIRPIAGTRPRGADPEADRAAEIGLLADPKERAEHLMLLDLGRNDVGRVAEGGSVRVTEAFAIERYSHVMHIVSNVVGRLRPACDPVDALVAGFPAGTVSGAPKVRAMEIIAALEPEKRGVYAGGVGYFAADGGMDSCIVLRTGIVKDGTLHVTAGAGIVADSNPEAEAAECRAKAGALEAAAAEALKAAAEPRFGQ
ncbi:anthranilate synthase component I family protein [Thermaurantiacus sp.]